SGVITFPAAAGDSPSIAIAAEQLVAGDAAICLEVPRPDRLIDRLLDPQYQAYVKLAPRYKKFLENKNFADLRGVAKVIAAELGTTWDQGLRDLTGGGILATVEAEAGKEPKVTAVITARKPELIDGVNQAFLKLVRQDAKEKGKPDPVKTFEHG